MLAGLLFASCANKTTDLNSESTAMDLNEDSLVCDQNAPTNNNSSTFDLSKKAPSELTYADINELLDRVESMIAQLEKSSMTSSTFNDKKSQIKNLIKLIDDADLSDNQEDRLDDLDDRFDDVLDDLEKKADQSKYDKRLNELEKMIKQLARMNSSSKEFKKKADQIEDLIDQIEDYDLSNVQEDRLDDLKDKFEDIAD